MLSPSTVRKGLLELLELLSQQQDFRNVGELVDRLENSTKNAHSVWSIIELLTVIGVLEVIANQRICDCRVRIKSDVASLCLQSLKNYLEHDLTIIENWERASIKGLMNDGESANSGVRFLQDMEEKRTSQVEHPVPLKCEEIAQAIIKARVQGRDEPLYLVQRDQVAKQYQLIGGHRDKRDANMMLTMQRELEEELSRTTLKYNGNYRLKLLASNINIQQISQSSGAFKEYQFSIYSVEFDMDALELNKGDLWVTLGELMAGHTDTGEKIHVDYITQLDEMIAGGIEDMPLSLTSIQPTPPAS